MLPSYSSTWATASSLPPCRFQTQLVERGWFAKVSPFCGAVSGFAEAFPFCGALLWVHRGDPFCGTAFGSAASIPALPAPGREPWPAAFSQCWSCRTAAALLALALTRLQKGKPVKKVSDVQIIHKATGERDYFAVCRSTSRFYQTQPT